ncbi:D-2-hydroxyacid dehydrogenase [Zooshikella harenae]|uniref:D-2-hydroxyacid dehydrogenase n=1 Tax=Zooshikella harenae TaxID=2827238 RepID=A0ABS5ZD92_9GAMM|nr:D-2-hydroxyacid dehydrogenase [Zooshikella harenae]MBU2710907.1 D-2-hydroxyacid dehydrogenase [Zooshikella harenae]
MESKGVILDADSLGSDIDLSSFQQIMPFQIFGATNSDQVATRIESCSVAFTNKVIINEAHMQKNPQLRYIGILATGTNNVDLVAAKKHGITVTHITRYGTDSVAQHTWGLILSLVTQQYRYQQAVKQGRWSASEFFCLLDYPITELAGNKLVIVGYGELGRRVAKIGEAFGMEVILAQVPGSPQQNEKNRLPLAEAFAQADIVSLHCPLTEQTKHLINEETLSWLSPSAYLINTARGDLIDEMALLQSLMTNRLAGAGLDVLAIEPPPTDHPLVAADLPNLLITPHCAWGSRQARQRLVDQAQKHLLNFLANKSSGVVVC